ICKEGDRLWFGRIHPDDMERVQEAFKALIEKKVQFDIEYRIERKDGKWIWLHNKSIATYEKDGVMYANGIFSDINERKRNEKALQERERDYRLLAENVGDIIWTMNMNLRFTYISPSVTRMRGYSVEEAMSQGLEEVLTPTSLEVAMKTFSEEMAIENMEQKDLFRSWTLELEQICKDGSTVWTESKMTFLRDPDGRAVGILG
ncbi:unnamed protein product, partial [marine sediment metagenome]